MWNHFKPLIFAFGRDALRLTPFTLCVAAMSDPRLSHAAGRFKPVTIIDASSGALVGMTGLLGQIISSAQPGLRQVAAKPSAFFKTMIAMRAAAMRGLPPSCSGADHASCQRRRSRPSSASMRRRCTGPLSTKTTLRNAANLPNECCGEATVMPLSE